MATFTQSHSPCLRAHTLEESSLPVRKASDLCEEFLQGFCRKGASCIQGHEICRIEGYHQPPPRVQAASNQLSREPRLTPRGESPFDDDGPGEISALGPRHDNDWTEIAEIQILPTADEMLSQRLPYMPRKDGHHHFTGRKRHLDTLFRQLRYESTEALIDTNYHTCQILSQGPVKPTDGDYDERMITPKGVRYHAYRDITIDEVMFDVHKSLMVSVSFGCPHALRAGRLVEAGRLEDGMLVTLVGRSSEGYSTTFMEVHVRFSTFALKARTGNDRRAGAVLSFASTSDNDDEGIRRMLYNKGGLLQEEFILVEVPGTLMAGFYYTLRTLQRQYTHHEDFAFQDVIAPESGTHSSVPSLPSYADSKSFVFPLDCLKSNPDPTNSLQLRPKQIAQQPDYLAGVIQRLQIDTTLDKGQASALCEGLSRGLALIQGAPGAGKTFLGVALAKVLLEVTGDQRRKPILVVALTNHALDSFLEDLKDAGIVKFARLGSQSKETWVKEFEIRNLGQKFKSATDSTKRTMSAVFSQLERLCSEGTSWCESLNDGNILSWPAVREYLDTANRGYLESFTDLEEVEDAKLSNIRLARKAGGFAYEHWCLGKDLQDTDALVEHFRTFAKDSLQVTLFGKEENGELDKLFAQSLRTRAQELRAKETKDLWALSLKDREELIEQWRTRIDMRSIYDRTAEVHRRHQLAAQRKRQVCDERDLSVLAEQDIIAMTTTLAARQWDKLKNLGIQIVICEEAAEVGEAQFISSMLPSVCHCIAIGDPLQLRPMINERALSIETEQGGRYRLDESLMERLMYPSIRAHHPFPASKLLIQRRMHPKISNLLRKTLYPHLKDHESTHSRISVPGLADRVFWLAHSEPENTDAGSEHPTSYSNQYELDMIAGMVEHLVNSNDFDYRDITILTPYNAQLAAFHRLLKSHCSIWLSEADRETLISEQYLGEDEFTNSRKSVEIGGMLRLATVDNFQGEESRVVILSLVRSNDHGRVGFLKTNNRINVAISRARNGLYMFGNASVMQSGSMMWSMIIDELKAKDQIGPSIRACCSRHRAPIHAISKPEQWQMLPPCQEPCSFGFRCGHICPRTCHSAVIHEREGDCACQQIHSRKDFSCGHAVDITCQEFYEDETKATCKAVVGVLFLPCGHTKNQLCSNEEDPESCEAKCEEELECGHKCQKPCGKCNTGGHECMAVCDKEHKCGHKCTSVCHLFKDCPPCSRRCRITCPHGRCDRRCSESCRPCVKKCTIGCEHRGECSSLCCLPCNILPCDEACGKDLGCGHHCIGICGETCFCKECNTEAVDGTPAISLPCGHILPISQLDAAFNLASVYRMDGNSKITGCAFELHTRIADLPKCLCPICNTRCEGTKRYGVLTKLSSLRENLDLTEERWNHVYRRVLDDIKGLEEELRNTAPSFRAGLKCGPLSINRNRDLVVKRGTAFQKLLESINKFIELNLKPYDIALESLKDLFGSLGTRWKIVPTTSLRFESLRYRCIVLELEANCNMLDAIECLFEGNGQSRSTELLIEGMKTVTIPVIARKLEYLDSYIIQSDLHNLKRVEVELRLYKIAATLVMNRAGITISLDDATPCASVVRELCQKYHLTAGQLRQSSDRIHKILSNSDVVEATYSPSSTSQSALIAVGEHFWFQWPKYQVGALAFCENGHPYSSKTQWHCPECGPVQQSDEEKEQERLAVAKLQAKLTRDPNEYAATAKQWASVNTTKYRSKKGTSSANTSAPGTPLPTCDSGRPLDGHNACHYSEHDAMRDADTALYELTQEKTIPAVNQVEDENLELQAERARAEQIVKLTPDAAEPEYACQQWALNPTDQDAASNYTTAEGLKCDNGHVIDPDEWGPCSMCEAELEVAREMRRKQKAEKQIRAEEQSVKSRGKAEEREMEQAAFLYAINNPNHDEFSARSKGPMAAFMAKYSKSKASTTSQVSVK